MSLLDVFLLAMALAMDCFTVSIVSGVIVRRYILSVTLRMALLFGLFQALMPFFGWLTTSYFSSYIESADHWIAFALLAFRGGKKIKDTFGDDEYAHFDPTKITNQLCRGNEYRCTCSRNFVCMSWLQEHGTTVRTSHNHRHMLVCDVRSRQCAGSGVRQVYCETS